MITSGRTELKSAKETPRYNLNGNFPETQIGTVWTYRYIKRNPWYPFYLSWMSDT